MCINDFTSAAHGHRSYGHTRLQYIKTNGTGLARNVWMPDARVETHGRWPELKEYVGKCEARDRSVCAVSLSDMFDIPGTLVAS